MNRVIAVIAFQFAGLAAGDAGLTREEAETAGAEAWKAHVERVRRERAEEMKLQTIRLGDHEMRFAGKKYGGRPKEGWSLILSMHGGGGTAAQVNDRQWQNQIRLGDGYRPRKAIYVAPRAPTDAWDLWHQAHIDRFFDRLIENYVVLEGVDPNRVCIMGYSAGGDGVYQLAPRMADRLAAAAMMAGHPNEASPLGLRNIGFALHVGANDKAYKRNEVAEAWGKKLKRLRAEDPDGYAHEVEIHRGKGHWMDLEDRTAVKWMQKFVRDPFPEKVVWYQDDVTHERFYWLALPEGTARKGQHVVASRKGQTVRIEKAEGVEQLRVLLNDRMLDLDKPVRVAGPGGAVLFDGKAGRSKEVIERTLVERGDPELVFSAVVEVAL